jgi:hypothetical protein
MGNGAADYPWVTPFLQQPYNILGKRLAGRSSVERVGLIERPLVVDLGIALGQQS